MGAKVNPATGLTVGDRSNEWSSQGDQVFTVPCAKISFEQIGHEFSLHGKCRTSPKQAKDRFMAYETIIVDVQDHISVITLNRPDALNALNDQLLEELGDALLDAQRNDKVRCIVLTGSEKAFAAGADIKMMSSKSFVDAFGEDLFTEATDKITSIRKPIIAAVSGYALGGGCELAMMCDFIICSDTAKFGQPK